MDSSATGGTVIAASHNGALYVSGDGGATFAPLPVTVGATAVAEGWYRAALSDDGTRIALAGNSDFGIGVDPAPRSTGFYVGNVAGGVRSWRQASAVAGTYTSVTMSGDGGVIGATHSSTTGGTGGQVLLSANGGTSFEPVAAPAGETDWRALALSDDARRTVLAAGTFLQRDGLLYVSRRRGRWGWPIHRAPDPAAVPLATAAPAATVSDGQRRRGAP